ncbi:thioesterase [Salinisphaera japonica YTM-1]|uniref:Thioesterase n=2 Tax=Salinisphaera TaxID=180541 RepID=A0A423PLU4_9GAMM|nr:thioesterase [Salinisphaera japonica YTM-1]
MQGDQQLMHEPNRADYAHLTPIKVKWGEMDSLGHVNNAVYFRYSEDGRIDYIHGISEDADHQTSDGPILADLQCSFRAQLRFPADVEIGTRVKRIGRSSLDIEQCLFLAGTDDVVAVYANVVVWFDYGAQTSMRIPETVRERIRALEAVAPEE